MRKPWFVSVGWILLFVVCSPTFAQGPTSVIAQGTSYYVFAQPGEATIEVLVLGDAASGVYVVGADMELSKFLALIGGTGAGGSADTETTTTIRLLREEGGQRRVVIEALVDELIRNPNAYPGFQDGDVFTIEREVRRRFNLRDTLSIVSSLGTVTLLVIRLIDFASN